MENPDFFSEGLLTEPLSVEDMKAIAKITQATETAGYYDEASGFIFFTDKGVHTTFSFDEEKQAFAVTRSNDVMEDKDQHTHETVRPLESADDINHSRAVALTEALAELRNPTVVEE